MDFTDINNANNSMLMMGDDDNLSVLKKARERLENKNIKTLKSQLNELIINLNHDDIIQKTSEIDKHTQDTIQDNKLGDIELTDTLTIDGKELLNKNKQIHIENINTVNIYIIKK